MYVSIYLYTCTGLICALCCFIITACFATEQQLQKVINYLFSEGCPQCLTEGNVWVILLLQQPLIIIIIIIIMEICKAPTLRLKALNKHTHIMYIEMENVIQSYAVVAATVVRL